ncbi:hypothetical protein EDD16DRAFT_1447419, partial [Pisolithus croceorrhizus]
QALEALCEDRNIDLDCEWEDAGNMALEDVLDGTEQLEVSNAGGELTDIAQELKDYRTCRDRILRRNEAFDQQLPALTQAYLDWSYTWTKGKSKEYFPKSADNGSSATSWTLHVIDVYRKS